MNARKTKQGCVGISKRFDGESVIGPARVYLKPYWKERGGSYFQEEGQ